MQIRVVACCLIALVDCGAVIGVVVHARNERVVDAAVISNAPQLPTPQGPYGVGRVGVDWVDPSRPGSCYRQTRRGREMMVYLWYPSATRAAETRGAYVPFARTIDANPADRNVAIDTYGSHWPQMVTGELYAHAAEDAPAARGRNAFPLILFSHGMGASQFSYTSLIEDLVSRGYVVAAVEHPCSTELSVFPGGRIVHRETEPAPSAPHSQPSLQQMMASALDGIAQGAADDRFVLNRLAILNHADTASFPLAGRLDLDKVAAVGHSAGGAFAARACQLADRIHACVDLEGELIPVELFPDFSDGAKFRQPILAVEIARGDAAMGGSPAEHQQYFRKREAQLLDCPAGSYYVSLRQAGMAHSSFSDGPLLNAPDEAARTQAEARLALIEKLTVAFLHQSLTHAPSLILSGGNAASDVVIRPLGKQK